MQLHKQQKNFRFSANTQLFGMYHHLVSITQQFVNVSATLILATQSQMNLILHSGHIVRFSKFHTLLASKKLSQHTTQFQSLQSQYHQNQYLSSYASLKQLLRQGISHIKQFWRLVRFQYIVLNASWLWTTESVKLSRSSLDKYKLNVSHISNVCEAFHFVFGFTESFWTQSANALWTVKLSHAIQVIFTTSLFVQTSSS